MIVTLDINFPEDLVPKTAIIEELNYALATAFDSSNPRFPKGLEIGYEINYTYP